MLHSVASHVVSYGLGAYVKRLACLSIVGLLGVTASARAEVYVYPRRPSQTNVRYADFDWKYIDIGTKKDKTPELSWGEATRLHSQTFRPPTDGSWAWPSLKDAPLTRKDRSGALEQVAPGAGTTGMP